MTSVGCILPLQYAAQAARGGRSTRRQRLLVRDGQVLASGYNRPISSHDPIAHAEIVALRSGQKMSGIIDCQGLHFVTLEPCASVWGAIVHARVSRVVFGATEPKAGAVCSCARLLMIIPSIGVSPGGGVLAVECGQVVSDFSGKDGIPNVGRKPDWNLIVASRR